MNDSISARRPPDRRDSTLSRGFTLIEILAVVLIMGFVMGMVFPSLRSTSEAARHDQALSLATSLEYARQRAIMTGKIHRVLIDVDATMYRVEWYVLQGVSGERDSLAARRRAALEGDEDALLLAPPNRPYEYEPIPNKFGIDKLLKDPFYFDGVDTPDGWLNEGQVAIVFDRDGTTDTSQIVISDPDGFATTLDILPLLETVRIREETRTDG